MVKTPPAPPAPPREQILAIAASVFAEHGFAGARIEAIARRAGVNKAMLYYYVGDKRALYLAVIRGVLAVARAELTRVLGRTDDPAERLRAVTRAIAGIADRNPHVPAILLREMGSGGGNLPDDLLAELGSLLRDVASFYRDGAERGVFRAVDPIVTHIVTVGGMFLLVGSRPFRERLRHLQEMPAASPQDDSPALAAALADLLLEGVRVRGGKRGTR
ncbi:MAG: TetR/AcrR family transcriptional regulator [Thermoanaerobaculia bacterium]